MGAKLDHLVLQVEAVLFASGKPLSTAEIAEALDLHDARRVTAALRTLETAYADRATALEVRRVGDRYALQLAAEFVPSVQSVTPMEMAPKTLRALTLIAYHQPILQSVLVRMMGDSAYEGVQHLRGMGLVRTEAKGSTLELTTTRRFAEYFGIGSSRSEDIRKFLEAKLGASPSAPAPSPPAPEAPTEPSPLPTGAEPAAPLELVAAPDAPAPGDRA